MSAKVLLVEDDAAIREMVMFALEKEGYEAAAVGDAQAAKIEIADNRPDLILLDWMLPGVSGVELARAIRAEEQNEELPIIMLTARGEEDDRVKGLDSGADDYISKPFSIRELMARIRALLRRTGIKAEDSLAAGGITLDAATARVTCNGSNVSLGPTEFRLLQFFMSHPERVYNRAQLLDRVWGANVYVEERTVDVHIRRLRKALEPHNVDDLIQTVRGMGYRFSEQG